MASSSTALGAIAAEQFGAQAGNGLDVARTYALLSQQEAGKITASIFLRYVRLPNRRELLI